MKKVNNKKGFTLAELLVVLAILAVLVAIAIPVFSSSITKAQETARNANMRSVRSAAVNAILQEDIAGGTKGWQATAQVESDGEISSLNVSAAASGDKESKPTSGVKGSYTVLVHDIAVNSTT